jgi:hypothetical protein
MQESRGEDEIAGVVTCPLNPQGESYGIQSQLSSQLHNLRRVSDLLVKHPTARVLVFRAAKKSRYFDGQKVRHGLNSVRDVHFTGFLWFVH